MSKYDVLECLILLLLFAIPLAVVCVLQKTFKPYTYSKLLKALNYSIIFQVILLLISFIFSGNINYGNTSPKFCDMMNDILIGYALLLAIVYIPVILFLNFYRWAKTTGNDK